MYKKYDKIKYLLREIYYNKDENIIPFTPVSSPASSPILSPTSSPPLSPILSPTSSPPLSPTSSPILSPTSSPILSPTSSPPLSPILSDFSLLKNYKEPLLMINKDILMEYIVLAYLFSISLFMQFVIMLIYH